MGVYIIILISVSIYIALMFTAGLFASMKMEEHNYDPLVAAIFWPISLIILIILSNKNVLKRAKRKYGREFVTMESLREYEAMLYEAMKEVEDRV